MRKCVVAVQGTLQFISGFIAMEWYGRIKHYTTDAEAVLLLFDFGVSPENEDSFADSIKLLSSIKKWDKIIFLNSHQMSRIRSRRVGQSVDELKHEIGYDEIDEIYVSRDYGFWGNQLLLNAYPKAARIVYGDAFGIVGDSGAFSFSWTSFITQPLGIVKSILRKFLKGSLQRFSFDAAVLVLPQDWSGKFLGSLPLFVPSHEYVVDVFKRITSYLPPLKTTLEDEDCYLFLLGNLASCGLTSVSNEVALYEEVIRENAPKGSTVVLRNHPRGDPFVTKTLMDHLKGYYKIINKGDSALDKLPIELFSSLITRCKIVPIFSASALHINYIYSKPVIMPLDEAKIKKYFFQNKIDYVIKGNSMVAEAIEALKTWDGKSPLWLGK